MNLHELRKAFQEKADAMGLKCECINDGTVHSQTAIIGEAPGDREVVQKMPLVGGSGAMLWRSLQKHVGTTRKDYYITNVSKRQVALGKEKGDRRLPLNRSEFEHWKGLLLWELQQLPNLKYVLAMGNFALEALTGEKGITAWRGSVIDMRIGERIVKVLFINNPAAILREPKLEVVFNFDIGKFKRVLAGSHKPFDVNTVLYPNVDTVKRTLKQYLREGDPVSVDIEIINNETACIGFANSSTEAMCVAFRDKSDHVYNTQDEIAIRKAIQDFFLAPDLRIIAQNGMFDMTWLWFKDRIRIPGIWFDTMLAHHTLYPQLPHNLGFLTTQYTDNPYYKDEKVDWREGGDINTFWQYNGKDCGYTLNIAQKLQGELKAQHLDKFFFDHVMRLSPHLARMTVAGVKIDMEMKAHLNETLTETVNTLLTQFQTLVKEATGDELWNINPNSPKQLSDLYFRRLKLVGRGSSTDAENRERMVKHPRTPQIAKQIIHLHNEYVKEQKFYSTYVKTAVDDDGRMRCTYNQTGTQSAPGRLSSSATLWGSGTNLQNQPERAHPMFVADEGYVFGYFDLSQAEARVVGWEANIEKWIEQFERARVDGKYDAHRALAADMFKIPYDEVPTFDRYDSTKGYLPPEGKVDGDVTVRYVAKRCRHGLNYRMGADRLATTTGLSIRDAELAYNLYHSETPELREWWAELEKEIYKTKTLFNTFGRRFVVMERITPEALESIVAFKPQSTIGDKVCQVIYQAESDDRWPKYARMALNVHDALICLAREDQIKTCLSILKRYAEEPIWIKGRELIIPAECKMSYADEHGVHRWSNLKTIEVEAAK